jgi:acyl-CoA thioester hydrolase
VNAPVPGGTGTAGEPVLRRRVEHVDTDASGVVHFSRHVSLMETAALEHLERHGAGPTALAAHGAELAVTALEVRYIRPCGYRDLVVGEAAVVRAAAASFRVATRLLREEDDGTLTELSRAELTFAAVACGTATPVPLPADVRHPLKGITVHVAADTHPADAAGLRRGGAR